MKVLLETCLAGYDGKNCRLYCAVAELWEFYLFLALRTWDDTADRETKLKHLRFGLREELGELCGIEKRIARGDAPCSREKLMSELGDLLWYAVVYAYENRDLDDSADNPDWKFWSTVALRSAEYAGWERDSETLIDSCYGRIKADRLPGADVMSGSVELLILVLKLITHCGIAPAEVAVCNLVKLADRAKRGVIKGSGDNR